MVFLNKTRMKYYLLFQNDLKYNNIYYYILTNIVRGSFAEK